MILFQMHIMYYESAMINETFDSIQQALLYSKEEVKIRLCLNSQTYIESPDEGTPEEMFNQFKDHPIFKQAEIVYKTDQDSFYNIADWRREEYDTAAKYTVWGESDCLLPLDFFHILESLDIPERHILTFASRPMWDNSWDSVTHRDLQGYSKPCQCGDVHRKDCIELLEAPYKYKDIITQSQLDEFNSQSDIEIEQVPLKIDGSLLCISAKMEAPFIAPNMHFVREDSCAENFFRIKNIPQVCVKTRLKGHNYWHPLKRTNTSNTRDDKVFKQYAEKSQQSMINFLQQI